MEIRRLQPDDVDDFWRLRLTALKEYPEAFGSSYEESKETPIENVRVRLINEKTNFVLGAFTITGELVGMVGFKQEASKKMRHKGFIWGMFVDQKYQGQGIGKALLIEVLKLIDKEREIEQINLVVVEENFAAKRLYESLGFIIYGTEINAMKLNENTYLNEHLMVKQLTRSSIL